MNAEDTKNFRFGNHTDIGRIRNQNEDFFGYFDTINGHAFIVCDGMGGHNGGAMASQTGVNSFRNFLHQQYYQDAQEVLNMAIQYANSQIYQQAQLNEQFRGMGTTCVAILIRGNTVYYAHVGDSRIYLFSGGRLTRLTKDHSFVQTMIEQGVITEEDAQTHPRRSELTKALGVQHRTEVEAGEKPIQAFQNDTFILSTDGLHSLVNDSKIQEIMNQDLGVQQKSMILVEKANQLGGEDNITVQLVEFFNSPLKSMQAEEQRFDFDTNTSQNSFKDTKPDFVPKEFKNSTPKNQKSTGKKNKLVEKNKNHEKQKSEQGFSFLPTSLGSLKLPKNASTLIVLVVMALGVTYIYFSPTKEVIKRWVIGKTINTVDKKTGINVKGADSTIARNVEKKAYDYILTKSPFLKNIVGTYDKVNKTLDDVKQYKNKTLSEIDKVKKSFDKTKKYFHKLSSSENLKDIADEYGVSVQELMKANKIKSEKELNKLDSIIIPLDKQIK